MIKTALFPARHAGCRTSSTLHLSCHGAPRAITGRRLGQGTRPSRGYPAEAGAGAHDNRVVVF